ncbi:hypothetical protein T02_14839 [Trichinella nativa]|uniref:Uncharacterized protein n=1 Tax=Trichinella nativa TaxID=6335 RepID=A0A0V1LGX6_9BILA|nr:hypothetical protein T02_14839 [Trichinella nativa]
MDPNWKGIKSLMDFYPKSESNAKTGKDAPTDLADDFLRLIRPLDELRFTASVIPDVADVSAPT